MVVWNTFENDARVLKEAETLARSGWRVVVHALHTPGETEPQEELASGVRVRRVMRSPAYWFWPMRPKPRQASRKATPGERGLLRMAMLVCSRLITQLSLLVRLIQSRPDVVHAHDVNVLPTGWLAAVFTRARLVYDAHEISTSREGYGRVRGLVACVERRLASRTDAMITTTELRARFFARAYGVSRPTVLYNWPPCSPHRESNRIQEELGLRDNLPVVLYQGGLQAGRGLNLLLKAAKEVENAHFVFIGGGRLEAELKAKVSESGLSEHVHFISTVPVQELPSYTASADIGVQPLENTCFNHFTTDSNKLFEYLAAGLPVVCTELPVMARVVRDWDVGRLVPPGDGSELAAEIRSLVDAPDERERLALNAREAARHFCWERQEHKLVSLYQEFVRK